MAPRRTLPSPTLHPNTTAVQQTLARLEVDATSDGVAQLALSLAQSIDKCLSEGNHLGLAAMAKELRACLVQLEAGRDDRESGGIEQLLAELSAPVRDASH